MRLFSIRWMLQMQIFVNNCMNYLKASLNLSGIKLTKKSVYFYVQ